MSLRDAALETLRRCTQALEGEQSSEERSRLCALQNQAIQVLANPRQPQTLARAERVRQLEWQMRHMEPAERAAAIRERMGLARSTYYNPFPKDRYGRLTRSRHWRNAKARLQRKANRLLRWPLNEEIFHAKDHYP